MKKHISASQLATWTRCRYLWQQGRLTSGTRGPEGGPDDTWAQRIGHFVHAVEADFKYFQGAERSEGLWLTIPGLVGAAWEANGIQADVVSETRRRAKPILNQLWDAFGIDETHEPDLLEHKLEIPLNAEYDLVAVLDDVTFIEEDKTLIIGEYKTSQSPIDEEERTLMTIQPYIYQWAAKQEWPDYKPVAVQYTLAHKGGANRVVRDLWPEDVAEWDETLRQLPREMEEGVIYRALSHNACRGCPLWRTDCSKRALRGIGPVGAGGGYYTSGDISDC